MTIEELISLTRRLEGQAVSFKTLAANSLLLNFNGPPGSPDLWTIWLEPSWRYESSSEVIVGSEGLPYPEPDQSEDDSEAQFSEFCHRSDPIEGTVVEKISIDPISRDMTLKLADGAAIRTFSSGHLDEAWRLILDTHRIIVFLDKIEIEQLKAAN